jgi:hypothetical protein
LLSYTVSMIFKRIAIIKDGFLKLSNLVEM